jgi:hypothetical protein
MTKKAKKKEKKGPSINQMSDYQYARWAALYQAVNLIADIADERNENFEELKLDQIAICKYVDEYSDDILYSLIQENEKALKNEINSWK